MIVMLLILFGWVIASNIIGAVIAGDDEEKALDLAAAVFLFPAVGMIIVLAFASRELARLSYEAGLGRRPSDELGDYIP